MNPEQVISLLEQVGEMLSPGVQEVWRITMQAVVYQGRITLAWAIVSLFAALSCAGVALHGYRLSQKPHDCPANNAEGEGCRDGGAIGCVLFLLIFAVTITTAITYLSIPEYLAMQRLIGMLSGGAR